MNPAPERAVKLGIFFSHPTQHHSAMFRCLANEPGVDARIYYYDPGSLGSMHDPGYGTSEKWDVDLLGGTNSVVLRNLLRGREVSMVRQFNPGVVRAVFREKFDAVLVAGYVSPSNWLVLAAARRTGAKILYQSDTNILDVRRRKRSRFKRAVQRFFLGRVDHFLAIGDHNAAAYADLGLPADRFVWCPYPVDMTRYEAARTDPGLPGRLRELRKKHVLPDGARVVVFCGKLIPRKRPQDVVEALRRLGREDVYALLIGSGELESSLRQSLKPTDRVRITGFVNQSQIPLHMLLGDVGVVSSEWDPHPLVTTEFAMCGLPLIVSDFCGVWGEHDILRPGENGFVYKCGDTDALAAQIQKVLDDAASRERMGRRSLELSKEQSSAHAARVIAALVRQTDSRPRA